jgi:hypothetical protein
MQSACAVLYCHLWRVWLCHLSTLSLKQNDFRGEGILDIKCAFWFSLQLSTKTCLLLRSTERDVINVHSSSIKYPLFLSDFNESWIFSRDFRKILIYQISWKPVLWESRFSIWTDRHITKLTDASRNFGNAPKTSSSLIQRKHCVCIAHNNRTMGHNRP